MTPLAITQAVIPCGGRGTRLGEIARDLPKAMVALGGRPLLDHTLELLASHGIRHCVLAAGYRAEAILGRYPDRRAHGIDLDVVVERSPMGTAGALHLFADRLAPHFLLAYGDIFLDFDISRLAADHLSSPRLATLLCRPSDHPWDSHLIDADDSGRIRTFVWKQAPGVRYRNVASAAVYALSREILRFIPHGRASDFGADVFPAALAAGETLRVHPLGPAEFVRDMGTPERLELVERHLRHRAMAEAARSNPGPIRAVFLDRDGTLNVERGLLTDPEQIELIPGAASAVARLNRAGIRCYIVTNQPVIARGLCTEKQLAAIHRRLLDLLETDGGRVEQIYYSPFHPETHHGDGIPELRRASDCRKPRPGMILRAAEEHGLDLAECAMIGDRESDLLAARAAGIRFLGVGPILGSDPPPDTPLFPSLTEAVDHLLRELPRP